MYHKKTTVIFIEHLYVISLKSLKDEKNKVSVSKVRKIRSNSWHEHPDLVEKPITTKPERKTGKQKWRGEKKRQRGKKKQDKWEKVFFFFTYGTSNVSSPANDITLIFFNPLNNPMSYTIPMQGSIIKMRKTKRLSGSKITLLLNSTILTTLLHCLPMRKDQLNSTVLSTTYSKHEEITVSLSNQENVRLERLCLQDKKKRTLNKEV